MNQDQFLGAIRVAMGALGSAAVTYGIGTSEVWAAVTGAIVTLAPIAWSWFAHTDAAKVLAASTVPGVSSIQVTPVASPDLQKIANDPNVRTVVTASPYAPPPSAAQRR